jgi:hypothetical protein
VCGGNREITAIICIYNEPVSICVLLVPVHPPSGNVVGEVMTERNISVLDNGKLDRGHCGTFVPV